MKFILFLAVLVLGVNAQIQPCLASDIQGEATASSASEATLGAQKAVSQKVFSQLVASDELRSQEREVGDKFNVQKDFMQKSAIKTEFEFAELIKATSAPIQINDQKIFKSVACLNPEVAAPKFAKLYQSEVLIFNKEADFAKSTSKLSSWKKADQKARTAWAKAQKWGRIAEFLKPNITSYESDFKNFQKFQEISIEKSQKIQILIEVKTKNTSLNEVFTDALIQSFKQNQIEITTETTCTFGLWIKATPEIKCAETPIGVTCSLSAPAQVYECGENAVLKPLPRLNESDFKASSSDDEELARKKVLKLITPNSALKSWADEVKVLLAP
jgi:hypothetical protein